MIKKESVVELAGGMRLRINSTQIEDDDTCEVMLTFDGDLIPVHIELLQFAPAKGPDTSHDVLILATPFGRTETSPVCKVCGGYRMAPVHDAFSSGVGVADHEFDPEPFRVLGTVSGRVILNDTHITDVPRPLK